MRIWHLLITTLIAAVALALARSPWGRLVLLGAATSVTTVASFRFIQGLDSRLVKSLEVGRPTFLLGFALVVVTVVMILSAYLCLSVLLLLAQDWLNTLSR